MIDSLLIYFFILIASSIPAAKADQVPCGPIRAKISESSMDSSKTITFDLNREPVRRLRGTILRIRKLNGLLSQQVQKAKEWKLVQWQDQLVPVYVDSDLEKLIREYNDLTKSIPSMKRNYDLSQDPSLELKKESDGKFLNRYLLGLQRAEELSNSISGLMVKHKADLVRKSQGKKGYSEALAKEFLNLQDRLKGELRSIADLFNDPHEIALIQTLKPEILFGSDPIEFARLRTAITTEAENNSTSANLYVRGLPDRGVHTLNYDLQNSFGLKGRGGDCSFGEGV